MTEYVVGIIFSEDLQSVLLMLKNRPVWQAGRFNFPGGKVEGEETGYEAIVREVAEECTTQIVSDRWKHIADIKREGIEIYFYATVLTSEDITPEASTDEPLEWVSVTELPKNLVYNVSWLVPYALEVLERDHVASLCLIEKET